MDVGETIKKGMIPLVFSGMHFNGSAEYRREDTGEVIGGEYVEVLEPSVTTIGRANGLICDTVSEIINDEKEKICIPTYCLIDEEASKNADRNSKVWGAFSVS